MLVVEERLYAGSNVTARVVELMVREVSLDSARSAVTVPPSVGAWARRGDVVTDCTNLRGFILGLTVL
jgi:hypothetical protein